ncbi:MAG TPA: hypothetical protein VFO93_18670 [Hymenobacter sp.]|uniref:hypothetical protein n=1 Tax=Hymenobacter sp. TaxID=1898978 RepID=UPI002D7F101B|nr:hypothetical protein [Hymenobacter sp.]HET9505574.1 hypothetical protein [Hymenobacter sp.]
MSLPPLLLRLWPWHRAALVGLWLLVQVGFLLKFQGPHLANDSELYLSYAANVAEHGHYQFAHPQPARELSPELPNPDTFEYEHVQRYIVYAWFESIWLRLGTGLWGIVLGQIAASGLAAAALYGATRQLAGGRRRAAALATLFFILWPDIQQFNCFLLTESLFISLSVLALAAFVRVRHGGWRAWATLGAVLLLAAFTRPNGFVLAGAALLAGLEYLRQQPGRRWFWGVVAGLLLAIPLALVVLNHHLKSYFIVETYARGELIFGTSAWAVQPAAPLAMPPPGTGQVPRILYFAAHNPWFLLKLMAGKLFVFVSGLKPHYSLAHRLAYVLVLWPLYWLAARGTQLSSVWKLGRVFLLGVPLLQASIVMLTVDDWDVRFQAPVLAFVFVLAALQLTVSNEQ